MQGRILSAIVSFCVLIIGPAGTVFAQMPGTAIRATIPFDFVIRGKTLPAGTYEVTRISSEPDTLCIRNAEQTKIVEVFNTDPVTQRNGFGQSELIFHRYGELYFLDEVAARGEETARQLIPSKQERNLERETASNVGGRKAETVTLAAN